MQSEVDEETFLRLKKLEDDVKNQAGHFGSPFRKGKDLQGGREHAPSAKKEEDQGISEKRKARTGRDMNEE